jgi:hypothetical protein
LVPLSISAGRNSVDQEWEEPVAVAVNVASPANCPIYQLEKLTFPRTNPAPNTAAQVADEEYNTVPVSKFLTFQPSNTILEPDPLAKASPAPNATLPPPPEAFV